VMILSGGRRQRIGDLAARTIVARDEDGARPEPAPWAIWGYPALWLTSAVLLAVLAFGFGAGAPYPDQVREICARHAAVAQTRAGGMTLSGGLARDRVATAELAAVNPPPAYADTHRALLAIKRREDRVAAAIIVSLRGAADPRRRFVILENQFENVVARDRGVLQRVGFGDCAF
jgi:hypothetical protein